MRLYVALLLLAGTIACHAQPKRSLADSLHYRVEMQATVASGEHSPLWLNANRYGLSSVQPASAYVRASAGRSLECDTARRWGIGYEADVALATGLTSHLVVQQLYGEVRWLKGVLTVGSKEYPMELKNQLLSSGSQTLGINARPVPQARLALPDYWTVPYTRGWLALKGHVAYGRPTDDRWQKHFTGKDSRYVENARYHSKAGYLRIGPKNITMEVGLEMACQFGGTTYLYTANGLEVYENGSNFRHYLNALASGGFDATDGYWSNNAGNHLGSWVGRLNMDFSKWALGIYYDHFFEDHSSMLFMDYDGYGSGDNWNEREKNRYFRYDLKDIMLGVELTLKQTPALNSVVLEYIHTKYQSGPVYHNNTHNISTHISGCDNYYNHNLQTGWQHWGMVMGNPLYLSPLYNDDCRIEVKNNRFVAWHLGVGGQPTANIGYRLLATWQRGYGTYRAIYPDPADNVSLLAETTCRIPHSSWLLKAAMAFDSGDIYGHNVGLQLTVAKTGLLKHKNR